MEKVAKIVLPAMNKKSNSESSEKSIASLVKLC